MNTTQIERNELERFIGNDSLSYKENLALTIGRDSAGKEYLKIINKDSWWFFIASKILRLKRYQLETIADFLKKPEFIQNHIGDIDLSQFYSIMDRKITHSNQSRSDNKKISLVFELYKEQEKNILIEFPILYTYHLDPEYRSNSAHYEAIRDFDELQRNIIRYNKNHPEKLKIAVKENQISFGYTIHEFNAVLNIPDCHFLKIFYCRKGNILTRPKNFSLPGNLSFKNETSISELRSRYKKFPITNPADLTVLLPDLPDFKGEKSEIQKIFSALLHNHKGLVVGENHRNTTPKKVLEQQMEHFYNCGVRKLFLEFCCHDTLQKELDDFYETKQPSLFLAKFLQTGFGYNIYDPKTATLYYDMILAAVKAGIRPIGLEYSGAQQLGWESFGGAKGTDRMLGLNVMGKEIIDKYADDEKYIIFVGSAHTSYYYDIAGFSEMCGIPSLVIQDQREDKNNEYKKNLANLDSDRVKKELNNTEFSFYTHVLLNLTS